MTRYEYQNNSIEMIKEKRVSR